MRKRLVDSYTDPATGITYGLRGSPLDFSLAQKYTHDHVAAVTRILMTAGLAASEVSGFGYTLAGGLSLSVAAGQAFDAAGAFYETITDPEGQPTVVTLDPADPTNPRIDLVYVQLEAPALALPLTRYFRRTPTEVEAAAGTRYPAQPIERYAEEHTRATVRVRKGTPAAVPVAPALAAGEAALFQVRVNAGAAVLVAGNVTDVRQQARSLAQAWAQIDAINANPILTNFDEKVQDALQNSFPDAAPYDWTYDDPNNRWTLDIAAATGAQKGLMGSGDKSKLDGVAAGAQVNVLESVSGTAPISVGAAAGKNQAISIAAATGAAPGSMSAADKAKLDASTSSATGNALAQRDANGDILFRNVQLTGKVPTYNNVATAGMGLGVVLFDYASALLTANLADVTMYTAPGVGAYLVCLSGNATGNGGDTISLTVEFTAYEGFVKTKTVQFTTGTQQHNSDVFYLYVAASTTIKFRTTGSTGSGGYRVHATLIRLS